jgi:hypothetical protein
MSSGLPPLVTSFLAVALSSFTLAFSSWMNFLSTGTVILANPSFSEASFFHLNGKDSRAHRGCHGITGISECERGAAAPRGLCVRVGRCNAYLSLLKSTSEKSGAC